MSLQAEHLVSGDLVTEHVNSEQLMNNSLSDLSEAG